MTEIVYALGEQDRLVARDSSSVFPPEAVALLREAGVAFEPIPSGYDAAGLRAKKRVMFILSRQDARIMASGQGTAAEEIIRLAVAENAVQGFQGDKILSDEAATGAAPDVLLMMNRGEATSQHGAPDELLLAMPAIANTPAACPYAYGKR